MRRSLSLAIALIGVLGLLGLAPAAQADHKDLTADPPHDTQPTSQPHSTDPDAVCAVEGFVAINPGVSTTPSHNHYRFDDTGITCASADPALAALNGVLLNVEAVGGTDGDGTPVDATHGETDLTGWSHKSCYADAPNAADLCPDTPKKDSDLYAGTAVNRDSDVPPDGTLDECNNCGEITVDAPGIVLADTTNFVMFNRIGNQVHAWGALSGMGAPAICFVTDLNFAPIPPGPPGPVVLAALTGAATVTIQGPGDDCGLSNIKDGGKK